jgi:DNA-binding response OmpR family regulator
MYPSISPKRILIVDDNPSVAEAIRVIVACVGLEADVARDGQGALAAFEAGKYHVVILDFLMPGMNGLKLARIIRQRSAPQRIILLTACADFLAREKELLSDVDVLLDKPFPVARLHEALRC